MDCLIADRVLNNLKTAATGVAAVVCSGKLKYLVDIAKEFVLIPASVVEAKDAICEAWTSTKEIFKSIEPYQPLAATMTIISKALWKSRTSGGLDQAIKKLKNRLSILKDLHRSKKRGCSKRIDELKKAIQDNKDDKIHSLLTLSQLGSLVFPHPGSNVWNSVNNLSGRLFSLRSYLPYFSSKKGVSPMNAALGVVSTAGTVTALLKQTGAISGDATLCHAVIGASFVGMAVDSGIMIKNWIQSRLVR